jgi:hypothetical protein
LGYEKKVAERLAWWAQQKQASTPGGPETDAEEGE